MAMDLICRGDTKRKSHTTSGISHIVDGNLKDCDFSLPNGTGDFTMPQTFTFSANTLQQ